mmetsp:Transcript_106697/g.195498  ORF Transcript_106697/g.195498 Transcript_106697/m.195498 type:complete len:207 (+) Transcript_106697:208-828(+)
MLQCKFTRLWTCSRYFLDWRWGFLTGYLAQNNWCILNQGLLDRWWWLPTGNQGLVDQWRGFLTGHIGLVRLQLARDFNDRIGRLGLGALMHAHRFLLEQWRGFHGSRLTRNLFLLERRRGLLDWRRGFFVGRGAWELFMHRVPIARVLHQEVAVVILLEGQQPPGLCLLSSLQLVGLLHDPLVLGLQLLGSFTELGILFPQALTRL